MDEYKLIIPSDTKLDYTYTGDYNKFKVAQNIAKAVNQAKLDGFSINYNSWKSVWGVPSSKWVFNKAHNWTSIISAVLMYADSNFYGSKFEATANALGIEVEWLFGLCSTLNNSYISKVAKICKRKSKKGQQCRDGREFGKLFKLAYLSDVFFEWNFAKTSVEFFNTHQWQPLDDCKTFISLGMNYDTKIKKCAQCNMYGGKGDNKFYKTDQYYINDVWDSEKYKFREELNLTCNEIIIKNLLS